jgi:hypothetical protein
MTDLPDAIMDEMKQRLLSIGEIPRYYADCRGTAWDSFLERLRETINYEFIRGTRQVETMVTVCEMIETERQHFKDCDGFLQRTCTGCFACAIRS